MEGHFRNKKVVITGPRVITDAARRIVLIKVMEVLKQRPHSITIGGARGVDSAVLLACAKAKRGGGGLNDFFLEVVVPGCLGDAPQELIDALKASALIVDYTFHGNLDRAAPRVLIVELGMDLLNPQSYLTRDVVMLGRAGWSADSARLLAFSDGKDQSVQAMVDEARRERVTIVEVPLPVEAT